MNIILFIVLVVVVEAITGKSLGVLLAPVVAALIALIKQALSTINL